MLYRKKGDSLDNTLTLTLTAVILFTLANVFPFMVFEMEGRVQEAILFSGVKDLYLQDMWPLAVLVLAVSIVFPLVKIFGLLYVLVPLQFNRRLRNAPLMFRTVEKLHPWAMLDVYMLGVIVAFVKLNDFATVVLGVALYSFAALIVIMAAADAALDPHAVWEKLEAAR